MNFSVVAAAIFGGLSGMVVGLSMGYESGGVGGAVLGLLLGLPSAVLGRLIGLFGPMLIVMLINAAIVLTPVFAIGYVL